MTTALRPEIERYLATVHPGAEATLIVSGASTRRFYRVRTPDGRSLVLMDYGLPFRGETDDLRLARLFREAGLRVAALVESSAAAGCLLLEDLGETSLEAALAAAGPRSDAARHLLERAVTLAAHVAGRGTPVLDRSERSAGPVLDAERFHFEMDFFLDHYVGALRGCRTPPDALREMLYALADEAAATPRPVLCHRDFHSRNLMLTPNGELAMVDVQDARWGPDTYDLVSILRDAYLDLEESWIEGLVEHYLAALDEPPAEGFASRLHRVSAQRMIKALGTFGYQASERRDARYLEPARRTIGRLQGLLPVSAETRPLHARLAESGLLDPLAP